MPHNIPPVKGGLLSLIPIYLQHISLGLRRGECGGFFTQKAACHVSNDLICMHCPFQICVNVGLPSQ